MQRRGLYAKYLAIVRMSAGLRRRIGSGLSRERIRNIFCNSEHNALRKEDRSVTTASDVWSIALHTVYREREDAVDVVRRVNTVTTTVLSVPSLPIPPGSRLDSRFFALL